MDNVQFAISHFQRRMDGFLEYPIRLSNRRSVELKEIIGDSFNVLILIPLMTAITICFMVLFWYIVNSISLSLSYSLIIILLYNSYLIGLYYGHFHPLLPLISDLGNYYPEAAIFSNYIILIGVLCKFYIFSIILIHPLVSPFLDKLVSIFCLMRYLQIRAIIIDRMFEDMVNLFYGAQLSESYPVNPSATHFSLIDENQRQIYANMMVPVINEGDVQNSPNFKNNLPSRDRRYPRYERIIRRSDGTMDSYKNRFYLLNRYAFYLGKCAFYQGRY